MKLNQSIIFIVSLFLIGLVASPYSVVQKPLSFQITPVALGDPWSTLWMRHQNDALLAIASSADAIFVAGTTLTLADIVKENIILLKYSTEGELLWNQTWNSPFDEAAYALVTHIDALYLVGKTTTGPYGTNGLLVKLDFDGNQLWNVSFGNFPAEWFTSITIGTDGIYVSGIVRRTLPDDADAMIAKFDFNGNELWSEAWDMAGVDRGFGVAVGSDGAYLVGDYGDIWDSPTNNAFLAKYSTTGVHIWNQTWGGTEQDIARAVTVHNDSIYVTGSTQSLSTSPTGELFLRNYNRTNYLFWETLVNTGLNHEGIRVQATDDTVYVGSEYTDPNAGYQLNLLNFNITGELNWESPWGGAGNCQPFDYTFRGDNHYLTGTTSDWLSDSTNGFLVKIGIDGETGPGPIELLEPIFLNPYGSLILSWTQAFDAHAAIDLYELQMDSTPYFTIPDQTWNINATSLLLSNHPIGTYYFRVRARDQTNLFGPWSNVIMVTVTLVPPTLFNPWIAPSVLIIGMLIGVAIVLWVFIRRWRIR
jgi:hypothetical protein